MFYILETRKKDGD